MIVAGRRRALHCVDRDFRLLPCIQVRAIVLGDLRDQLQTRFVEQVGDRPSGKDGVAGAVFRDDHPGPGGAVGVVVLHRHQTVERRPDAHLIDVALRRLHREARLVPLFFEHGQRCAIRGIA